MKSGKINQAEGKGKKGEGCVVILPAMPTLGKAVSRMVNATALKGERPGFSLGSACYYFCPHGSIMKSKTQFNKLKLK